ncbi:hypothetical protein K443DRAFT_676939, partial [Laccaria amethystina LaAM-08-1]
MTNLDLTSFILDQSLIDYTLLATRDALTKSDGAAAALAKKRAIPALEFFTTLLDPSIEQEKVQLDAFKKYLAALDDESIASEVLASLPKPQPAPVDAVQPTDVFNLTPAQRVLGLPETLSLILSHVSPLSKPGRETYKATSLVSRSFHHASQITLWSIPRDLDTVEHQVRFAFGASISIALSEPLGNHVKRLRIRRVKGGWNDRIIHKIAKVSQGVEDLTLHCGDVEDGVDPITPTFVLSLHTILSSPPKLRTLNLCKFSYTPVLDFEPDIPADGYVPFANLESLTLYGFDWYWPAISKGVGANLKSLDIGLATRLADEELLRLSTQTTALTSLNLSCSITLRILQSFVNNSPGLESITVHRYDDIDDALTNGLFAAVIQLSNLKTISFNHPIGNRQLTVLQQSSAPLADIDIKIQEDSPEAEVNQWLTELIKAKKQTLTSLGISFEGSDLLKPTDALVTALAGCPQLNSLYIDAADAEEGVVGLGVSASVVESLLRNCPNLRLTPFVESLVTGNEVYEKEFKQKLQAVERELELENEEDILGN